MKKQWKKKTYLWFILPGFIVYTIFTIYPIFSAIPNSFVKWAGVGEKQWVGLKNYITLFTHPQLAPQFFNAAKNTGAYLVINLLLINTISLLLAYVLFKKIPFNKIYQTIIFSPHFLYPAAIAFMYTLFFDPTIGLYSKFMSAIGLEQWSTFPWLDQADKGVWLLTVICNWKGIGYTMLLYIAGYTMVSRDYEEAAKLDGANGFQVFTKIYLPMIKPTFINVIVLSYIWSITLFDIPYSIGGREGGLGRGMDVLENFFYRTTFSATSGFSSNFIGMGSAISVVLLIAISLGSGLLLFLLNRGLNTDRG